jgi:hypothetical protein
VNQSIVVAQGTIPTGTNRSIGERNGLVLFAYEDTKTIGLTQLKNTLFLLIVQSNLSERSFSLNKQPELDR